MFDWLSALRHPLNTLEYGRRQPRLRSGHRGRATTPALVELLETRQLLAAVDLQSSEAEAAVSLTGVTVFNSDPIKVANGSQSPSTRRTVAVDQAGNSIVVYGANNAVTARRFQPDGTPLGNTITIPLAGSASVAMNGDGRFTIVWSSLSESGTVIRARQFAADGSTIRDLTLDQGQSSDVSYVVVFNPTVAMGENGTTVVTWGRNENGVVQDKGVVINAQGTVGIDPGMKNVMDIDVAPDGRFMLVGGEQTANAFTLQGRSFSANGAPASPVFSIVGPTTTPVSDATVGIDDAGNATIAWLQNTSIQARRYNLSGSPQGAAYLMGNGVGRPVLAVRGNGGIAATWINPSSKSVELQQFQPDGTPLGSALPANDPTGTNIPFCSIALNSTGAGAIAWTSLGGTSGAGEVFVRTLKGQGIKAVTTPTDEANNGVKTFGTYIEGVPLQVEYTVELIDALGPNEELQYRIDGEDWIKFNQQVPATSKYTFKHDMGDLQRDKDSHPLEVRIVNSVTQGTADTWKGGNILTTDDLDLTLKGGAVNDSLKNLDRLRFLDDVSVATNLEADLVRLPLFDTYKNKLQLEVRQLNDARVGAPLLVNFQKSGQQFKSQLVSLNSGILNDRVENGVDYRIVLVPRENPAKDLGSDTVRVETVPKWLTNSSGLPAGSFDTTDKRFEFHASFPQELDGRVQHTTTNTPLGLFDGLKTNISAGLNFDVFAGLSIDEAAYAKATKLDAEVVVLDKTLVDREIDLSNNLQADLDRTTLVTSTLKVDIPDLRLASGVTLIDVSFGEDNKSPVKIGVPEVIKTLFKETTIGRFIDLSGSLQASTGDVNADVHFVLDVSDSVLKFKEESTVTISMGASVKGQLTAAVGIDWLGVDVVKAGATGTLWANLEAAITVGINGPLIDPKFNLLEKDSFLAAQAAYQLQFNWAALGKQYSGQPIKDAGQPKVILGDATLSQPTLNKLGSFKQTGNGIVPPTPAPKPVGIETAALTVAAAEPAVSTLEFVAPLDPYATQVALKFDVESDVAIVPANAHRFAIVAIPMDSALPTLTLKEVDLSTYPLSPVTGGLGFRSAPAEINATIDGSALVPGASYRLVLRLANQPAQGETVRVRPTDIQVTTPDPTLKLTAPGTMLADGVIDFDTEAGGKDYVDLQISNTATPLLLLDDLRVEGAGYALDPAESPLFVYYGDDVRTLRVQITNPALANAGTLRFKTNDPTRPEVVLALRHTPSNQPPVVRPKDFLIGENSVNGAFIGTVTATDPDPGQTKTFAITAGNTNNAFTIHPTTGVLTVNNSAALDFEKITQFPLTVTVTDNGNPALSASAPVRVFLRDVNEAPVLKVKDFLIGENSANGAFIGTLTVTDPDAGQTATFQIIAGNKWNAFAIHPTTGVLTVKNSAALDFETTPQFDLTIKVTDSGNPALSSAGVVKVFLRNMNDAPIVRSRDFLIGENSVGGAFIGGITATDADAGQTKTFSITNGNIGNAFTIHPTTGVLTVNQSAALDFEQSPQFNLTVTVTDNGNPAKSGAALVRVYLRDVNEAPVIADQSFAVKTWSPFGSAVGTVVATDPDAGQALTYAIESGNGLFNNVFRIDANTGKLTVNNGFGVLFPGTYSLKIRVTDNASPSLSTVGNITIHVNATGTNPQSQLRAALLSRFARKGLRK